MAAVIGRCGREVSSITLSDLRVERKGYLSLLTFSVAGVPHRFEMVERGRATVILPVDFTRRLVYLTVQPRVKRWFARTQRGRDVVKRCLAGEDQTAPITLPIVEFSVVDPAAGMIENGETPIECAIRELKEEAGIVVEAKDLKHVGTIAVSIGFTTELLELFLASVDRLYDVVTPAGDGNEIITVLQVSFDELFDWLDLGYFENAGGAILIRQLRILDLQNQLRELKVTP